ncbi:MAG TPA: MFS transporter [Nocardioides sp.]|uniref:MFS transporter n=1 Tax=Nocardioides sp. TaxID=35761 RepID=UPI002E2F5A7A|nr:MFS transporter [Nocardioides sp.]HEX5087201.1 MFS transporter [Nocardioides sp.]
MTTTTAELQHRTLRVLVVAQVLSGAGLAAGVTVGALLAQDMLGSTGLAGLPAALLTAGSAVTAVAIGRISQEWGRRPGLATGYAVGALGSVGVVVAAVLDSSALLFAALFVYGAGSATNLQARYAGADLAEVDHRARAISTVLVATTLGGVVGPLLAAPTGDLAHMVGVPHLAGPFLLAGVAYLAAAVVLATRLRPDPLLHARELASSELASSELASSEVALTEVPPGPVAETRAAQVRHGILVGATVMVLTQAVMVAIMTMTPVHMRDHGHGTAAAGAVIALHVAAMYLPSPVTGRLVDRVGRTPMAIASGVTLLLAGVLAAVAPDDSVLLLALALALLGLGWNFGLVSGTAIITDAVPIETRARTQGWVDVSIAIAGAGGGLMSGVVVEMTSYSVLSFAGGLLALAILPAIAGAARPRTPLAAA